MSTESAQGFRAERPGRGSFMLSRRAGRVRSSEWLDGHSALESSWNCVCYLWHCLQNLSDGLDDNIWPLDGNEMAASLGESEAAVG